MVMSEYEQIPDDFEPSLLENLEVTNVPRDTSAHSSYRCATKVTDHLTGNEFTVISEDSREGDISDYFTVIQNSGEPVIATPTTIKTEMWPSGGENLVGRAILTAAREFEQL